VRRRAYAAILLLAPGALFLVLAGLGAGADYATYDERPFLHYGLLHLEGPVPRKQVFNSKLPVTALHAIPVALGERSRGAAFDAHDPPDMAPWALAPARGVGVRLGVIFVLAMGLAGRWLAGPRAGAAAGLLAALEPNGLAHFHYVTADGGATLASFLLILACVNLARRRRARDAALAGVCLGLVLLCKFMLVVLAPLALLALAFESRLATAGPRWTGRRAAACLAAAALATIVTIDAGFLGRGLPGHLPLVPRSHKVSLLATAIGQAPLPLPTSYLEGLDWTAGDEEQGASFGNLYLLGHLQTDRRGFPAYYLVTLGLKLPLAILALFALALSGVALAGRRWLPRFAAIATGDRVVIWTIALGYLLFLSLFNRAQIGVRHALPVVGPLLLEAGTALAALRAGSAASRATAFVLVVWLGASVVSYAPDFLPYTNELILDRKLAFESIADSNLDWGQSRQALRDWLLAEKDARRDVTFEPGRPVAGRVVVGINALVGVTGSPERYAWLRALTPVSHVRNAYLVFDVRPDELPASPPR
jgi:hypothetical protein